MLIQTIRTEAGDKENRGTIGLTMLDKEFFVLRQRSSEVDVYDSSKLSFSRRWNLKELLNPIDIGSCNRNKCVYNFNRRPKGPGQFSEILRVDPHGHVIKKWPAEDNHGRLSVTGESNVILTGAVSHTLKEYSPMDSYYENYICHQMQVLLFHAVLLN